MARPIDGFLESYRDGSDRLRDAIRPLREAPGEFMKMGPGPNAGDASGKLAYEPGTPGGEDKGARSGGGVTQGFSKGDVKAGAPWDTTAQDSARRLSMRCRDCGERNYLFEAARAFKCHECGSVTNMRSQAAEAFAESYYGTETDMHRQVREASRVADGMDHDEEAHDSRRGASDGYPVDKSDPEDPMSPGWNGDAVNDDDDDEGEAYAADAAEDDGDGSMGGVGGSRMSPGMDVTSEDEDASAMQDMSSEAKMRAAFKCAKCNERVMHPMRLAKTAEGEASSPVSAKCSKGHASEVAPPAGFKFTNKATEAEAVATFFQRYLREANRGGFMP